MRDWPEIQKLEIPPSEVCSISGDWEKLGIPNLARMSNEMLLNAAKWQRNSFYRFWVITGKPTGGECKITLPSTRLRLKLILISFT